MTWCLTIPSRAWVNSWIVEENAGEETSMTMSREEVEEGVKESTTRELALAQGR